MNKDLAIIKKKVERLKRVAEEFPFNIETGDMPDARHWANLPGGIRICFTKKFDNKEYFYHLSVSQSSGNRVNNSIVMPLLKMLNAPQNIKEMSPLANAAVRHFVWEEVDFS